MTTKLAPSRVRAGNYVYSHITKLAGVCGGKATLDGRRVRVMDIVSLYQDGYEPEQILKEYDFLNLAQIYAALAYYYDRNQHEIESSFEKDRRFRSAACEPPLTSVVQVKRDRE